MADELDSQGKRLAWAREKAGFKTASAAARALGVPEQTYLAHENSNRGLRLEPAQHYARRFRVNFAWLMSGHGMPSDRDQVPIVGYVGAGPSIFPFELGGALEMVDAPTGGSVDCVGARVRGESMYPQLLDGWLIFWRKNSQGVPPECLNALSVVKLADDGPTMVKRLRPGNSSTLFTLESFNAEPKFNVRLDWAAKVIDIRPT